jgi:hypothetical protein
MSLNHGENRVGVDEDCSSEAFEDYVEKFDSERKIDGSHPAFLAHVTLFAEEKQWRDALLRSRERNI